jgi:hypothetical protein
MQEKTITHDLTAETDDANFSFRVLIREWWQHFLFVLQYWRVLVLAAVLGGVLGLGYAWWRKPTYTAKLSFVVEEAKTGAGSVASALAGQIGLDIGGLSGGNGILAGDNVLELLKSRTFIKNTLLTPYNDSTSSFSLADRYAEVYGWKKKWASSSAVGKMVNFPAGQTHFSRMEDSLMHIIIKRISDKELNINKPDKKLGFFDLENTSRDERFSQLFVERLLKIATDFYIETKTKRLSANVYRLQRRADSLAVLLDRRTYSAADAERMLLDANPAYTAPMVNAEISSRNKFIQSTVYAEVVKNLEISKTALIQETPTVQIVDHPELPLKENKTPYWLGFLMGMAIGGLGLTLLLMLLKSLQRR